MSTQLDAGQLARFAEQGYLVLPAVFDAAEVERMRGEADRILELVINSSLALDRTSGRLDLTPAGSVAYRSPADVLVPRALPAERRAAVGATPVSAAGYRGLPGLVPCGAGAPPVRWRFL